MQAQAVTCCNGSFTGCHAVLAFVNSQHYIPTKPQAPTETFSAMLSLPLVALPKLLLFLKLFIFLKLFLFPAVI